MRRSCRRHPASAPGGASLAALALAVLCAWPAPPAHAGWLKPTSAVAGSVRLSWTWSTTLPGEMAETSAGAIRYEVQDRAPGTDALLGWVPGEFPSWSTEPRRLPGFFLRARATVERFRREFSVPCGDGASAVRIAEVTSPGPSNALLMTDEPEIDIVRRTGRIDVDPPFLVRRDGVYRLGQVVLGTGSFTARETGSQCEMADPEATVTTPRATPDTEAGWTGSALMGFDALVALTDAIDDIPLSVTAAGGLVIRRTTTVEVSGSRGTTGKATMEVDLRVSGPSSAHSALCRVPTDREVAGLRSAAGAQRLARRRGFTRVWIGRPVAGPPGGRARYTLNWGSSSGVCGAALGTRRSPVLFPLRRGRG